MVGPHLPQVGVAERAEVIGLVVLSHEEVGVSLEVALVGAAASSSAAGRDRRRRRCGGRPETILGGLPTSATVVEIDAGLARHHAAAPLWSDEGELERRPHPETDARGLKLDHQFISREGEKCGEFPKLLTSDVASNLNLELEIQFWQFTMSGGSERRRGREEERLPVSCSGVSLLKRYAATPFGSGHRTLELRCWDLRTCKTSSISGAQ